MRYSQLLWKVAGCGLTLAACAPGIKEQQTGFTPAPSAEESSLVVRNDYFGAIDVFVVTGAGRTRLGSVGAARTGNLRIPRTLLIRPEIQFQVDPVGPEEPFTYRPISVGAGNVIELSVAPTLQMSSYAIVLNQ